jgi:hypothetical protein
VDVPRLDLTPVAGTDHDVQADVATAALATGGPQLVAVVARATDGDNLYMAQLSISYLAGHHADPPQEGGGYGDAARHLHHGLDALRVRLFPGPVAGHRTELKARAWSASATEPSGWQVTATDSSLTAGGSIGCRSVRQTANTNTNLVVSWDNVQLLNPQAFSVTRSQNGVVKAHAAGAPVRLAFPAIASL